jgi:hypothetical protein
VVRANSVHCVLLLVHVLGAAWLGKRLLPKQPLSAMFIFAYVGMYLLNPIAVTWGLVPLESDEGVFFISNGLLMIGLDLFAIAVRHLHKTRWDIQNMPRLYLPALPTELCIAGILAMCAVSLALLIAFVGKMDVDIFTVSKSFRTTEREVSGAYLGAAYVMMLLPLAVFLIGLKRRAAQLPYLAVVILLIVVHFMIVRVRVTSVACLVAYLTGMVARSYLVTLGTARLRWNLPRTRRLTLLVAVPTLALLTLTVKFLRQAYSNPRFGFEITQEHTEHLMSTTFAGGDLGYAMWLRVAMMNFPARHPYLYGQSYYRLLFAPIPRFVWPTKPLNTQRVFAQVVEPSAAATGLTLPPGLVGDMYINFGYLGVLGMFVLGVIFAQERYRGLVALLLLAGSGCWIFYLVRGSSTTPYIVLMVVWLTAWLLTQIIHPVALTGRVDQGVTPMDPTRSSSPVATPPSSPTRRRPA